MKNLKNNLKKVGFSLLLSLLLAALLFPLSVQAAGAVEGRVIDRMGYFKAEERKELDALLADMATRTGCSVYITTHKQARGWGEEESDPYWGEDFLEDLGRDLREDVILLVITYTPDEWYYDLYLYGAADKRINSTEVDYILDDDGVYDNLKSGHLAAGCRAFLAKTEVAYAGRLGVAYWKIAIVAGIIAILIGVASCFGVWNHYKMKRKSVDYPLDRFAKLDLTKEEDEFKGSFITTRVINTSSGGRGGGSHGGGRGHAGGR